MVTAMEDANGVREEVEQEGAPQGQPGMEVAPAVQSNQGADASGGKECRGGGGVSQSTEH